MVVREPVLEPIAITELRPTQITVGMREVKEKQERIRRHPTKKIGKYIGSHMIPVVKGPKKNLYVIDHHHLSLALHKEGIRDVYVTVTLDLSALHIDQFWTFLDNRGLVHPYDEDGRRRAFSDIPKTLAKLKDDPYRSLAGELRRFGGYAKDTTPFSEFLWADALRGEVKRKQIEQDFPAARHKAIKFAKSQDARYLPGWCGRTDE